MDDDLTPTDLVPRPALPCASGPWSDPKLALQPASRDEFRRELTACLALVGAVGMTEDARSEWLRAAWATLNETPGDLLARGCKRARETCDHPSKIVPAILEEIREPLKWRRESYRSTPAESAPIPPARRVEGPNAMTEEECAEMNDILGRAGAATRYKPDGTRFYADTAIERREQRGPLRKPTRQDYLDMGVPADVLDRCDTDRSG